MIISFAEAPRYKCWLEVQASMMNILLCPQPRIMNLKNSFEELLLNSSWTGSPGATSSSTRGVRVLRYWPMVEGLETGPPSYHAR